MTKIKICGLRRLENALAAAEAGADYLGIVFEPHSRRCVDMEDAKRLVHSFHVQWPGGEPQWVGVFANQPLEEVNRILSYCDLDMAQLSGDESPEYCAQVVRPVVKVVHVRNDAPAAKVVKEVAIRLIEYQKAGYTSMLDTYKEGVLGGTGQAFDWAVARKLAREHSFLLAGGLNPENVAEAMRQVRPWGLDVSSGVETGGQKDAAKIADFIDKVRRTDEALRNA